MAACRPAANIAGGVVTMHEKLRIGLVTLAGCIAAAMMIFVLDLPGEMIRGERGRQAIQVLDDMRRPLLAIKDIETRLLQTRKAGTAQADLARAIESADAQIDRYRRQARYNPALLVTIERFKQAYAGWIAVERDLFEDLVLAGRTPSHTMEE